MVTSVGRNYRYESGVQQIGLPRRHTISAAIHLLVAILTLAHNIAGTHAPSRGRCSVSPVFTTCFLLSVGCYPRRTQTSAPLGAPVRVRAPTSHGSRLKIPPKAGVNDAYAFIRITSTLEPTYKPPPRSNLTFPMNHRLFFYLPSLPCNSIEKCLLSFYFTRFPS